MEKQVKHVLKNIQLEPKKEYQLADKNRGLTAYFGGMVILPTILLSAIFWQFGCYCSKREGAALSLCSSYF